MVPSGRDVVVMLGGAGSPIVIDRDGGVVSVCDNESVTCGVKLKVPAAEGVPEITPVEGVSVIPFGSEPDGMLQVNGPVPPLTWSVRLYGFVTVPFGRSEEDVVVMFGGEGRLIVRDNVLVAV